MRKESITIIIPALNEEGNIRDSVSSATYAAEQNFDKYEIIVLNDGSTDNTLRIVEECISTNNKIRVITNPTPRNIGFCYDVGRQQAKMKYCVMVQGDNPCSHDTLCDFFAHAGKADFICGYWKNPEERNKLRQYLSTGYTRLLNFILRLNLKYYNGFQLHATDWLKTIDLESTGFGFQAEVLVKALIDGKSYIEVPIAYTERPGGGITKAFRPKNMLNVWRTILLLFLIKIKHKKQSTKWKPKTS